MMSLSAKLKKPDVHILKKYSVSFVPILIAALLLFSTPVHSQSDQENDTIIKVEPGTYIQIRDSISFFLNDTLLRLPSSIIPATDFKKDKNLLYYDSLKAKASRKPFTKKLYDLVVISPQPVENKKISSKSDENYISYKGKKIKNDFILSG